MTERRVMVYGLPDNIWGVKGSVIDSENYFSGAVLDVRIDNTSQIVAVHEKQCRKLVKKKKEPSCYIVKPKDYDGFITSLEVAKDAARAANNCVKGTVYEVYSVTKISQ